SAYSANVGTALREEYAEKNQLPLLDRRRASDQPRQLAEAACDAVSGKRRDARLEHQGQLAAAALESRRRQHAGLRRRDQVRDANGRAEDLGPAEQDARDQFSHLGREFLVAEAGIAVVDREPEEGATLMGDGAEIAVG